jgi:predicted RNA-binding protein associated with RNAse of E/G family
MTVPTPATPADRFWQPGQQIRWTYRRPDWRPEEAQTVHPMTVVRDDDAGLVAWLAGDTPVLLPRLVDGTSLRTGPARTMFTAPRMQGRGIWHGNGTLRIAPAGKPWSVWLFRDEDGAFANYYVNLEQPHRREDRTTISSDHVLDIVVQPDHTYHRKDEDELAEAVRQGRYTAERAASIEHDADEVEAVIEAWGSPFRDGWENWQPDPAWPIPPLPEDIAFQVDLID